MNIDSVIKYDKEMVLENIFNKSSGLSIFRDDSKEVDIKNIKKGDSVMIRNVLIHFLKKAFFQECQNIFNKNNPDYEKKKNWVKSKHNELEKISKEALSMFVEYFDMLDEKEQKRVLIEIWRKRSSDEEFENDDLWREITNNSFIKLSFIDRINSFKSELKKIAYGKDIVEKKYNREVYGWLSEALGNRLEDCLGKTDVDYIFERLENYFKVMGKQVEAPTEYYKKVVQSLYAGKPENYDCFMEKVDEYRFTKIAEAITKNIYVGNYNNIEKFIKFMDDLSNEKKKVLADIVNKLIIDENLPEKSVLLERVVKIDGVFKLLEKNLFNQNFFKEEEKDGLFIYYCNVYSMLKMKELYNSEQMLEKEGVSISNLFNMTSTVREREISARRVMKEIKENNPESDMENLEAELKSLKEFQLNNYVKVLSLDVLKGWLDEEKIHDINFSLESELNGKMYLGLKIEAPLEFKDMIKNVTLSLLELKDKKDANMNVRPLFEAALMKRNIDDTNVKTMKVKKF